MIFSGSATGMVALQLGRDYIGIDLNEEYLNLAKARVLGQGASKEATESSDEASIMELFT